MDSDSDTEFGDDEFNEQPEPIRFLLENYGEELVAKTPELSLSGCSLSRLPPSLRYFPNLRELNLAHNDITRLASHQILRLLPNLRFLSVAYNRLFRLEDILLLGKLRHLETLDFRENPIPFSEVRTTVLERLIVRPNLKLMLALLKGRQGTTEEGRADKAGRSTGAAGGVGGGVQRVRGTPLPPRTPVRKSSTRVRLDGDAGQSASPGGGLKGPQTAFSSPFADSPAVTRRARSEAQRRRLERAKAVEDTPHAQMDTEEEFKSGLAKFLHESRVMEKDLNDHMTGRVWREIEGKDKRAVGAADHHGDCPAGTDTDDDASSNHGGGTAGADGATAGAKGKLRRRGEESARETRHRVPLIFSTQTQGRLAYFGVTPGADSPMQVQNMLKDNLTREQQYLDMNPARVPSECGHFPALRQLNGESLTVDELDLALMGILEDQKYHEMLNATPLDYERRRRISMATKNSQASGRSVKGPLLSAVVHARQVAERTLQQEREKSAELALKMKKLIIEGVLPTDLKIREKDEITLEVERQLGLDQDDKSDSEAEAKKKSEETENGEEKKSPKRVAFAQLASGLRTDTKTHLAPIHPHDLLAMSEEERFQVTFSPGPDMVERVLLDLSPNPLCKEIRVLTKNSSKVFSRSLFHEIDEAEGVVNEGGDSDDDDDDEPRDGQDMDLHVLGDSEVINGAVYIYPNPDDDVTVEDTKLELNQTRRLLVDSERLLEATLEIDNEDVAESSTSAYEAEPGGGVNDSAISGVGDISAMEPSSGRDSPAKPGPAAPMSVLSTGGGGHGTSTPSGSRPRSGSKSPVKARSPPNTRSPSKAEAAGAVRRRQREKLESDLQARNREAKKPPDEVCVLNLPGVDFRSFTNYPTYGGKSAGGAVTAPPELEFAPLLRGEFSGQRQFNREVLRDVEERKKRRPARMVNNSDSIRRQKLERGRRLAAEFEHQLDRSLKGEIVREKVSAARALGQGDLSVVEMRAQLADDAKRIEQSKAEEVVQEHYRRLQSIKRYGGKIYLEQKLSGSQLAYIKAARRKKRMADRLRDEQRRKEAARLRASLGTDTGGVSDDSEEEFRDALKAVRDRERRQKRRADREGAGSGSGAEAAAADINDGENEEGERQRRWNEREEQIKKLYAIETVDQAESRTRDMRYSVQDVILETAKIRQKMGRNLQRLAKAGDRFVEDELRYEDVRSDAAYLTEQYLHKSVLEKDEVLVGDTFLKYSDVFQRAGATPSAKDGSRGTARRSQRGWKARPTAPKGKPKAWQMPSFPPTPTQLWGSKGDPLAGLSIEDATKKRHEELDVRREKAAAQLAEEKRSKYQRQVTGFVRQLERLQDQLAARDKIL